MQVLRNALDVLEALAESPGLSVSELARRTGLARTTAHRCLVTLADAGWVMSDPGGNGGWRLSLHVLTLVPGVEGDLRAVARPEMERLRDHSGESVHLSVLDRDLVVLIERVPRRDQVQLVVPVGSTVPAHASAMGKTLLAWMDPAERRALLAPSLEALTDRTVTTAPDLDAELDQVRRRGYAHNAGDWHREVVAVAAPVLVGGRAVASISVSSTPVRLDADRRDELAPEVQAAGRRIAAMLAPLLGGGAEQDSGTERDSADSG